MLELHSILSVVINALLLGDRQCQLPVGVMLLRGCASASAPKGCECLRICSLPSHHCSDTGVEEMVLLSHVQKAQMTCVTQMFKTKDLWKEINLEVQTNVRIVSSDLEEKPMLFKSALEFWTPEERSQKWYGVKEKSPWEEGGGTL